MYLFIYFLEWLSRHVYTVQLLVISAEVAEFRCNFSLPISAWIRSCPTAQPLPSSLTAGKKQTGQY